jgi:post-segregation antitoxin (ccd killing protein)
MDKIITIRIPSELKEKMKRYRVNWSAILRKAIEDTIRKYELREAAEMAKEVREKTRYGVFDSVKAIKEDRSRVD